MIIGLEFGVFGSRNFYKGSVLGGGDGKL